MRNLTISLLTLGLILSGSHVIASDENHAPNLPQAGGQALPGIEDLRDPSSPSGLNLAKAIERENYLRTRDGTANDISTHIVLVMAGKDKIKTYTDRMVGRRTLLENIRHARDTKDGKQQFSAEHVKQQIAILEGKIEADKLQIVAIQNVNNGYLNEVSAHFGIDRIRLVNHIPSMSEWKKTHP